MTEPTTKSFQFVIKTDYPKAFMTITVESNQTITLKSGKPIDILSIWTEAMGFTTFPLIICCKGDTITWSVSCEIDNTGIGIKSFGYKSGDNVFGFDTVSVVGDTYGCQAVNTGFERYSIGIEWGKLNDKGTLSATADPFISCN